MEDYPGIEIEDHEVLEKEEERELIRKAQEGDMESRNELIEHNQKLSADFAYKIRRRYDLQEQEEGDLYLEGIKGMVRAIEKFDLDIGTRFSTYAAHWIKEKMLRYIKQKTDTVREPEYIQDLNRELCKYAREKEQNIRMLDLVEAAEDLEVSENKLKRAARSMGREAKSMEDISDSDKSYNPKDRSDGPDDLAEKKDMGTYLLECLEKLDERQERVIRGRYFKDQKLREIGENLNLTRERIRQIEEESLAELRNIMDVDE